MPEAPAHALDLGSGGGVPGLVLAERWPSTRFVLIDSERRRVNFLERAVTDLGWADRVLVMHARAEDAGRDSTLRSSFDYVSARAFGPPAVVAECGAPFLNAGGLLVVSDPPTGAGDRWPASGLEQLGLRVVGEHGGDAHATVLRQESLCPERFPRRPGIPTKRPLF